LREILGECLKNKWGRGERMGSKKTGCLVLFGLFAFIVIIVAIVSFSGNDKTPEKKVSTKTAYTEREVYQFVMDYEVHGPGYTVAALTDLLVGVMQAQGDAVDVVEGQAKHRSGDIWEVSCVVVVNYTERHKLAYEADMNSRVVEPINKAARDLWGK